MFGRIHGKPFDPSLHENPKRSIWTLAFIYGFTSLLNCFQIFSDCVPGGHLADAADRRYLCCILGICIFRHLELGCRIGWQVLEGTGQFPDCPRCLCLVVRSPLR